MITQASTQSGTRVKVITDQEGNHAILHNNVFDFDGSGWVLLNNTGRFIGTFDPKYDTPETILQNHIIRHINS